MKYLVNRETKEHIRYDNAPGFLALVGWDVVEADAEGWIKWHGDTECPLPDNCSVELVSSTAFKHSGVACGFCWNAVRRYRPILDKPESTVKESLTTEQRYGEADGYVPAVEYDPRSVSFNVLKRLEAAHEAAQRIPELEAKLRDVLGRMGYDLVSRSPFVEPMYESDMVEGSEGFTNTEPDMGDWRNWREGDLIEAVKSHPHGLTAGKIYLYRISDCRDFVGVKADDRDKENGYASDYFRFHSRPEAS